MTAKEYLVNVHDLDVRTKRLADAYEELRSGIYSLKAIGYDSPSVITSKQSEHTTEALQELSDIYDRIHEQMLEYWKARDNAIDMLARIGNESYADLLQYRYIKWMSWRDVAFNLTKKHDAYYSIEHVRGRMHREALASLQRVLDSTETQ